MKRFSKPSTFYCFSPPVMIATFIIEAAMALYVLYRYKRSEKAWVIVSILLLLAAFQLAEYYVCTNSSISILAARLGFVAITFLPPLGLYLMFLLTGYKHKTYLKLLFLVGLVISAYFLFAPQAFETYQCTGNYVIFQIGPRVTFLYQVYYFGLILQSLITGALYLRSNSSLDRPSKTPVKWLIAGYAFFIVPVAILTVFHPDTSKAIPSILCGFAITLAIVLVVKVAPATLIKKK